MMNNLLSATVLAGLVGTAAWAPVPEPAPRSVASRPAPSVSADVAAGSPIVAVSNTLPSQHPPIPIVRGPRAVPAVAASPEARASQAESLPQTRSDRSSAQAAIEADGYSRVTVLGRSADGTWRAKAYRGTTEVQVTVDGAGRVSSE
jgi:hypothetical protein